MTRLLVPIFLVVALLSGVAAEPGAVVEPGKPKPKDAKALEAALERLKLPGVKINLKERCVDVDSVVALDVGTLEFIACTRDTKEHESILIVEAKPSHIHTGLLLMGAKPGHPAMRKPLDEEGMRFIDLPPRGGPVDVFLFFKDKDGKEVERPISDFIVRAEGVEVHGDEEDDGKFPTHTFLFAGSILWGDGDQPRKYIADQSGSVISLSTFGDELLCLPGVHGHANGALMWEVAGDLIPDRDTKVILRLRPQLSKAPPRPAPQPEGGKPKE